MKFLRRLMERLFPKRAEMRRLHSRVLEAQARQGAELDRLSQTLSLDTKSPRFQAMLRESAQNGGA